MKSRSFVPDESKLQPPLPPHHLVAVPRLEKILESALDRRVVFIEAPAGYGKTTWLLRLHALAQRKGYATMWAHLDSGDNDIVRFVHYGTATLARALPHLRFKGPGATLASWLRSVHTTLIPRDGAAPTAATAPLALFFDDYHVIHNEAVHDAVRFFIHNCPGRMRVCIASRSPAPLRLGKLRLEGDVLDIGTDDLSLRQDEAAGFFVPACAGLTDEQLKRLHQRTEGWVAGLQLASSALRKSPDVPAFVDAFSGSDRDITRYLGEIVLDQLPGRVRHFLTRTALFERYTVGLCRDVLQMDDAPALIDEVRSRNLFLVSLDREEHWYRYHHLFADHLRRGFLQAHADEARLLRARASAWFERERLIGEAVRYALAAGDHDRAAALISAAAEDLGHMRGEHATLQSWITSLPPDYVRQHPALALISVWSLMHTQRHIEAQRQLHAVEESMASGRPQSPVPHDAHDALERRCAMTRCALHAMAGQMEQAQQCAMQWLSRWEHDGEATELGTVLITLGIAACAAGDLRRAQQLFARARRAHAGAHCVHGNAWAEALQAGVCVDAGDMPGAEKILASARQLVKDHRLGPSSHACALLSTLHAQVCYERNRPEQADRALQHVELFVSSRMLCHGVVSPHVVQARVLFLRGSLAQADAFLVDVSKAAERAGVDGLTLVLSTERVHLHLRAHSLRQAQRIADAAGLEALFDDVQRGSSAGAACWDPLALGLVVARLLDASGNAERAEQILLGLLEGARGNGRNAWRARLLCVVAQLRDRRGLRDEARALALEAAELAVAGGLCRSLMDEGPLLAELLREAAQQPMPHPTPQSGMTQEDLARLLELFGDTVDNGPPQRAAAPADAAGLSQRELEILRLVDCGLRNQELAARLFLSQATVKWHLQNIYVKLRVRNRTAAVARARELSLLDP